MKQLLLLATLLVGAVSSANAEAVTKLAGWTLLAEGTDYQFYGKNGSLQRAKGIRSVIIQQIPLESTPNKDIYYSRFLISDQDCKQGVGTVKLTELSGKLKMNADYVNGGNSIAAAIADVLCGM
ncbi:hypothetical protein HZZ08_09605 [Serratia marcescens]|nr:hypothetical protein HZZ08_09605 [Serratia marcescens]QLJ27017.1 hypothetical protein HZZ07_09835 [Serratia marcescens]QLJ31743.1 hypothetical protein HZZ06_12880 [Serratia marcescens]